MIYCIQNSQLRVEVSSLGAELQSIQKAGFEYLWQGSNAFWEGKSPVLFPFCGRNTDNRYSLDGQEYSMPIHGFARSSEFLLSEKTDSSVTLTLNSNAETLSCYPRAFRFSVKYEVSGNELRIRFTVANTDQKPLYFGLGLHPGFNLPLEDGAKLSDHVLCFPEGTHPVLIGVSDTGYLTGLDRDYPLKDNTLALSRDFLLHPFSLTRIPHTFVFSAGGSRSIRFDYPDMRFLTIWQVHKEHVPYICLEPWTSMPARENEVAVWEGKKDLCVLDSRSTYENRISLAFT